MLRRILLASIIAGLVAGIALTALQSGAVTPLILAAETYETAAAGDPGPLPHRHGESAHSHAFGGSRHEHDGYGGVILASGGDVPAGGEAAAQPVDRRHGHAHDHGEAGAHGEGLERTAWTAVSNVATAIGFALLLVALFAWRGNATWPQGLLWGAAGFVVFFANPAIGLRPEVPGAFAAELLDRQLWWLFAVACSGAGVGLLLLVPRAVAKLAGAGLLALPHLAGAPHPEITGGLAPRVLGNEFMIAAAATNAIFWLILGLAASVAFSRFSRS